MKQTKKYTGCNLKTMGLLHCAPIVICAVIRSNTVGIFCKLHMHIYMTGSIMFSVVYDIGSLGISTMTSNLRMRTYLAVNSSASTVFGNVKL